LAKLVSNSLPATLVVCGGDGTFMWVITELYHFNIDHTKVPIAIIPLGTGNDLAQVLGWGEKN
jgi:diacylglycerol kinase (ATP)